MPPPTSALIDDALKQQLGEVLCKLDRDVVVMTVKDDSNQNCIEMSEFLAVIASLSPHIQIKTLNKGSDPTLEAEIEGNLLPVAALYDEKGVSARVRFHGVPGGQEINSFVLALYNCAGPGQALEQTMVEAVGTISEKVDIKVCISLACHHCPGTVVACQRVALLNPNVTASMVDARLYPDLLAKYNIERVPALIVNDSKVLVGTKNIQQLCDLFD